MKRLAQLLLFLLLAPLLPIEAWGALNSATVWELRTVGADTNGCGFVIGQTSITSKTDLAVDSSVNTQVTSAGYGFTSADVGRYINITAGTGFTLGYYRITAVSASKATLDASPAAVSTGSGSFTIYSGLDYTQQSAANSTGSNKSSTDAVAVGTTSITSATASFTADIIGNTVYFSGGTGSIAAQRRAVTGFTNSTTIVIDTAIAASTGMTMNIGGACATWDEVFSARGVIAGNKVFVKADGTYATTAGYNTALAPLTIVGYTSVRTDRGQATLQGSAAAIVYKSTGTARLFNLIFDCNSVAACNGVDINAGSGLMYKITAKNYDGYGIKIEAGSSICDNCEAVGGTTNATAGIQTTASAAVVINSTVHDGNGSGIVSSSVAPIVEDIVYNQAGATADCFQLTNSAPLINVTGYNCGRHGINHNNTSLGVPVIHNAVMVGNGGFGVATNATNALPPFPTDDNNLFYNNTSGTINTNITDRTIRGNAVYPYVFQNQQVATASPFISTGSKNFGLNNTASAGLLGQATGAPQGFIGSSAIIGYPDMGAVTHNINQVPNFAY